MKNKVPETWVCKDCLWRSTRGGKDLVLNYFCEESGNDYPFVESCRNRITLFQIKSVLHKVPYSILEEHLKRRKEENEDALKNY